MLYTEIFGLALFKSHKAAPYQKGQGSFFYTLPSLPFSVRTE